jgi:hypothetical protein
MKNQMMFVMALLLALLAAAPGSYAREFDSHDVAVDMKEMRMEKNIQRSPSQAEETKEDQRGGSETQMHSVRFHELRI